MDAVKFIEERNRMCKTYYEAGDDVCSDCPAKYEKCTMLDPMEIMTEDEIAKIVKIVEEWATAHPCKTRQSVFLEQYPEALVGDDGVLKVCPSPIFPSQRSVDNGCARPNITCSDCRREFWMQEVK